MPSRISKTAKKSMVIVVDTSDSGTYCSGCVMVKDRTIMVIAPSEFVKGREDRLKVIFFDKVELGATLIATEGAFCSLRTDFHPRCDKISLLQEEQDLVEPQPSFMFVPLSCTTTQKKCTYITVESLKAYPANQEVMTVDSDKYFLVSCDYFGKTMTGVNMLTAAPVFNMLGRTVGIVLQDCRHKKAKADLVLQDCRQKKADSGREMKVALKARYVRELRLLLNPPAPPGALRRKRKRKHR